MHHQSSTADRELARIARNQHGVVSRAQLLRAGVTVDEIRGRLRKGSLLKEHRGVYRVGHRAPSIEARYLAAVLACGEGALLSGRAAAHLYGLTQGAAPPPEVTAPTVRKVKGVKTHRGHAEATTYNRVPTTTVPRTLLDLSSMLPLAELARATHEAQIRHGTTPAQVEEVIHRRRNSPGVAELRRILTGEERVTLSALERRFLQRLREARLPLPQTNAKVGTRRVDCHWPEHHLTVELDGYRYHHSRHAWELDRRREREARARGDEFRRFTYGDVLEDPGHMLRELRAILTA